MEVRRGLGLAGAGYVEDTLGVGAQAQVLQTEVTMEHIAGENYLVPDPPAGAPLTLQIHCGSEPALQPLLAHCLHQRPLHIRRGGHPRGDDLGGETFLDDLLGQGVHRTVSHQFLAVAGLEPVRDNVLGADDLGHDLRGHAGFKHIVQALGKAVGKLIVLAVVQSDVVRIQPLDGLPEQLHPVLGGRPWDHGVHSLEVPVIAQAVALRLSLTVEIKDQAGQPAGVPCHGRHQGEVHRVLVVLPVHHNPHGNPLPLHQRG